MNEEVAGSDEIARKPCAWAKFAAGKDAKCGEDCPFEKCIYDIQDDAYEEIMRVISLALKDYKK